MKKLIHSIIVVLMLSAAVFAQAPQSFKYQAVARDANGDVVANQAVGMQISILQGSTSGIAVYTETHADSTNQFGLVTLEIGAGTTTDDFTAIDWSSDAYFIQIEMDATGGTSYTLMGTSQLLSVPYALHANTVENVNIPIYTTTEIAALSPENGQALYNSTDGLYQIYNGISWVSFNALCWPQPTAANAGSNQSFTDTTIKATLAANSPETNHGAGTWSIISGTGGSFANVNNQSTIFTGTNCTDYILRWTIATSCGSSTDEITISFNQTPTTADAGSDQSFTDSTTSTSLVANTPTTVHETGLWTIESGTGGSFTDANSPTSSFSGNECTSYTLKWTISTSCDSSSDNVNIIFNRTPTTADAGSDQTFTDGTTSTSLAANAPVEGHGTGQWTIVSGTGGSITDASSPISSFTGVLHECYTLRWTISTNCSNSTDNIVIAFHQNVPGSSLTDIEGNTYSTVWIGNQLWMAENIRTTHYSDNTVIPLVTGPWGNLGDDNTTKAYCWYSNDSTTYAQTYGALYTWAAAMNGASSSTANPSDIQGVCPDGWHLPSDAEWKELEMYLGMSQSEADKTGLRGTNEGSKLAGEADLWYDYVLESDAEFGTSGFLALPSGDRDHSGGGFYNLGFVCWWWSSTDYYGGGTAIYRRLYYNTTQIDSNHGCKSTGSSVRCVRDK